MISPQEKVSFVSPLSHCSLGFPAGNKTHYLPGPSEACIHVCYKSSQTLRVGQFFCCCFAANKNYFLAPLIFSSSPRYLNVHVPHLLFPSCSPNITAPILFISVNAY